MIKFESAIEWVKNIQESELPSPCPRCGKKMIGEMGYGREAMSRRTDVHICSKCGTEEAFEDFAIKTEKPDMSGWWLFNAFDCRKVMQREEFYYCDCKKTSTASIVTKEEEISSLLKRVADGNIEGWEICGDKLICEDAYEISEKISNCCVLGAIAKYIELDPEIMRTMWLSGTYIRNIWFSDAQLDKILNLILFGEYRFLHYDE